jgi:hypothetical protein
MKLSRLILPAVFTLMIFSSNAIAASVAVSDNIALGKILPGESSNNLSSFSAEAGTNGKFNYLVTGKLAPMTQISVTMSATKPVEVHGVHGGGLLEHGRNITFPQVFKDGVGGSLPFVALSDIGTGTSVVYNVVVQNLTKSTESFSAFFKAFLQLKGNGSVTVIYAASAVPLPPAFLLFGAGLGGLGFFAKRRKTAA